MANILTRFCKAVFAPENVACDRLFVRPARHSDVIRENDGDMWSVMFRARSLNPGENIDLTERALRENVNRGAVLVAEESGKITGFGIIDRTFIDGRDIPCVHDLFISPEASQTRTIDALITGFAKQLRAQGIETMFVFCKQDEAAFDSVCSRYDAGRYTFIDYTDSDIQAYRINGLTDKFSQNRSRYDSSMPVPITKPGLRK